MEYFLTCEAETQPYYPKNVLLSVIAGIILCVWFRDLVGWVGSIPHFWNGFNLYYLYLY